MKQCTKCNELKSLDEFFARKRSHDGKTPMCKHCYIIARRDYYKRNTDKVLETNKKSWHKNREQRVSDILVWQSNNREKVLAYKIKSQQKDRQTVARKIRDRIASGIRRVIKGGKADKTFNILPYTKEQVMAHLFKTIPAGYTLDDFMAGKLHIDHKIPVSAFNITDENCIDFRKCFSLNNLQLLPAHDNLVKWNKLDKPFQPSLAMAV